MLARRFLWVIAILIILVIAAAAAYRLFGGQLLQAALVPRTSFAASPVSAPPNYRQVSGWLAQPRLNHPARWTPPGYRAAPQPDAVVFFVADSAYFGNDRWTMPLADAATDQRAASFLKAQASVFNGVAEIWAPRYRAASFAASITASRDATLALNFAYADVLRAFDVFITQVPFDAPIILAGHGQGSRQLLRLLNERVAGAPVAKRIAAIYLIGWPVSVQADLPATGFAACTAQAQTGCILSWSSFADPADPRSLRALFDASPGLTGEPHRATAILCTNPLSGGITVEPQPAARNIGALVPDTQTVVAHGIGAQCLPSGVLSIGSPPARFGEFVLPGNSYHFYDYQLFWANLRADAEARVAAFMAPRAGGSKPRSAPATAA